MFGQRYVAEKPFCSFKYTVNEYESRGVFTSLRVIGRDLPDENSIRYTKGDLYSKDNIKPDDVFRGSTQDN